MRGQQWWWHVGEGWWWWCVVEGVTAAVVHGRGVMVVVHG